MAQIRVSSQSELQQALKSADPGTVILLESGNYGDLNLSNLSFSDFVTLKSADGNGTAKFNSVNLDGVSHLRFDGILVHHPLSNGQSDWAKAFTIDGGSHHIEIVNSEICGSVDGNYDNDGYGLFVRNSSNIVVEGNEFHDLFRGAVFNTDDGIVVRGNTVHGLRSDGFDFAAVRNAVIEGNSMTGFHPNKAKGDHPDFIQFWSNGTSRASENVVIRGNCLIQDSDDRVQGIFIRDEKGNLAPKNFEIHDNIIYNTSGHGISVLHGQAFNIHDNTVLTIPGSDRTSRIAISDGSNNVDVHNNIASQIVVKEGSHADVSGNLIAQWQDPNGDHYYGDLFVNVMKNPDGASDFALKNGSKMGANVDWDGGGTKDPIPDTSGGGNTGGDHASGGNTGGDNGSAGGDNGSAGGDDGSSGGNTGGGGSSGGDDVSGGGTPGGGTSGGGTSGWTIHTSDATYTLRAGEEQLNLTGSASINGYGNDDRNVLTGNSGGNMLRGYDGDDRVYGGQGNDFLDAGAGNDLLKGGDGRDILAGDGGADSFRFQFVEESQPGGGQRDIIADFNAAEGDQLDLSRIDADANTSGNQDFHFIGTSEFTGEAGQLRYADGILAGDVSGNGQADFEIHLVGNPSLHTDDFLGV